MRDIISEIWSTVSRNKLRTALTGFAVAWGIFMLIFLLGAGNGLIHAMNQDKDKFLTNSMEVFGGYTEKGYKGYKEGRQIELNAKDFNTTSGRFRGVVDMVGAELEAGSVTLSLGKNYYSASLSGIYPGHFGINKKTMAAGREINRIDIQEARKVIVVSETAAKELLGADAARYGEAPLVGRYVKAGSFAFRVVGIYKDDGSMMNNGAYTAFTTVSKMYGKGDKVGNLLFTFHGLDTEADNEAFEDRYRQALNANHDAAPDDNGALWLWNRYSSNLQMQQGMNIIRTALWIVGLFTLLSGVVGVSNIMLITVKERTREFGIRKAIGASPRSILRLIIIESIITTTFFGYIGMVCGIAANEILDARMGHDIVDLGVMQMRIFVDPTVGIGVCLQATAVMIIAGTIAGLIPARKAARIRPIEALRAE